MNCVIINQSSLRAPRKFISDWIDELTLLLSRHKKLKNKSRLKCELTIVFMDKNSARRLNFEHRQKNYATDVLSFESMDPAVLGELVICPQVLKAQAREHGLSFRDELGYMLIHGVLHLLGYQHESGGKAASEMYHLQDSCFEKMLSR